RLHPALRCRPARSSAEILEIAGNGSSFEAGGLVCRTCGGVTIVVAGFDHHHRHPGLAGPCEGALHERGADASSVAVGIDDEDVDLAHAILGMQPRADPSRRATVVDGDVNAC